VARPCQCPVCAGGRYGAYTVLVHQAQADTDTGRAQTAHAFLAIAGPMAGSIGADGRCPGDALAAPMLARLYPSDPPAGQPGADARIAEVTARFQDEVAAIMSGTLPATTPDSESPSLDQQPGSQVTR
jgi:hypothetical protein